jgi:hypothetical protein
MTEIVGREHRVRLKAFGIADGIDAEFENLRWQAMSTAQPFRLRATSCSQSRNSALGQMMRGTSTSITWKGSSASDRTATVS